MRWYIPSRTGDFRLEAAAGDADASLLTVENPTPEEIKRLTAFLSTARSEGWCSGLSGIAEIGRSELRLAAPVRIAGVALAAETAPRVGQLTVVRSQGGVLVADVDPATAVAMAEAVDAAPGGSIEQTGLAAAPAAPVEPVAAVTTKKPTLCCPFPVDGPLRRSSEVLKSFCTARQWKDWTEHGWLIAYGQASGHAYRVVHRHHKLAQVQGKSMWDLDDDQVVHCWDWSVPPAEEVLGMKLVVEHREPWIRNPSGMLFNGRDKFHNPLGHEYLDGTDSAAAVSAIGTAWDALRHMEAGQAAGKQFRKILGLDPV